MISHSFLLAMIVLLLLFLLPLFSVFKRNKKSQPHLPLPPSPPTIPIIGHLHLLKPLIHHAFRDLSERYGPLISLRLGSARFIVVNTPSLAKEFLKTHELVYSHRKMNIAINMVVYDDATFAFAPYGSYWKFIKKLSTTELLGNRTIGQFLPIRTQELDEFIQTLTNKSKARESLNLTQALLKLSNNIISRMMLSIETSGTDNQAEQARALVREVTQIFGEFNVSDFIGFFKNFDLQGFKKRALDIHKRYDALLEKIISDREESRRKTKVIEDGSLNGEERLKDFLDILLNVFEEKDLEVNFTRSHIKSLILDYFTAATDTTAISVEWAISELFNNPRVLKKAQEEVERVVGKERLVCEEDSPNLPYIHAIIKETMRLHPPIPMIMRKGMEDCVVDGKMVPKGSMVCVNIWAMGRDQKIWENALDFKPERFLENKEGNNIDMKGHHYELLPFGSGRRGCPGMPLAMRQLPTVVGALVQCFEWKMLDSEGKILDRGKTIDMDERPGLTAPRANDLICIPISRMNPNTFLQLL
ncbi:putative cytochrome P450 [Medicago truncatula]|uniref:Putative cytochrome P450 n=1 Tax=Medicago truncatula TaxID=3880 RepID=A0A396IDI6_MEDTR|nr:cytochrome P450 93B16 [Medicago truncatula]RHN60887.1 putative cytochrome P450 [Medicago truncatula]